VKWNASSADAVRECSASNQREAGRISAFCSSLALFYRREIAAAKLYTGVTRGKGLVVLVGHAREAPLDRGFDKIGCEEGQRDCHIDFAGAASFSCRACIFEDEIVCYRKREARRRTYP
jgi:hypothetical protein